MAVALIIIYNHQYNKNIEILEKIYRQKFSKIYHLVPFYCGNKENVIPVYENSFYFQGYVAQGLNKYFDNTVSHYLFIADDLILNPIINETNYCEYFGLSESSCFLSEFITLHELRKEWPRVAEGYNYKLLTPGIEAKDQIPEYNETLKRFNAVGLSIKPLAFNQIWHMPRTMRDWGYLFAKDPGFFLRRLCKREFNLPYPLVGGYSDIFVVSSAVIRQFCHYCGVFAATNLFVELAIPTSMVMSTNQITTESSIALRGQALWTKEDYGILDRYEGNLEMLLKEFPGGRLFLHPVKLSKWRFPSTTETPDIH